MVFGDRNAVNEQVSRIQYLIGSFNESPRSFSTFARELSLHSSRVPGHQLRIMFLGRPTH